MEQKTVEIIDADQKDKISIYKRYNDYILSKSYKMNKNITDISKKLLDDILICAIVPSMIRFYHMQHDFAIGLKLYGSEAKIILSFKGYFEIFYESYKPIYSEYKKFSKYEFESFQTSILTMIKNNLIQPEHFIKKMKNYVFMKRDTDATIALENYINYISKHAKIVGYKDNRYDRSEYLNRFSRDLCSKYRAYAIFKNERKAGFFMIGVNDRFKNPHLLKDEVIFHFYKLRENNEWPNNYSKKEAIVIKSNNDIQKIVEWFNN